jgi:methyl-accepting chemotaxis protein
MPDKNSNENRVSVDRSQRRGALRSLTRLNISLILTLLYTWFSLAYIISSKFTEIPNFTVVLSNSATAISIVLGLVAIIFSIVSGDSLNRSLGQINEASNSLNKIRDAISDFIGKIRQISESSEANAEKLTNAHDQIVESQNKMNLAVDTFENNFG